MLWDTHMHCHFSGDSDALPRDMINAAINNNLAGICFTDHQDFDYKESPGLFDLDAEKYTATILKLKEEYRSKMAINLGVEIGLLPSTVMQNLSLTEKYPFDFVIGSSHVVDGVDPYYPAFFEDKTEEEAYLRYFESILDNLNSPVDFDVYGHIDYIVRYGPNKNLNYSYDKYSEVIDEILKLLIGKGKGIEINTAGFKYGLGHPNPTEEIISRYRELGGEIITIGSDAHKPEHIAYDFDRVPEILKASGFEYYTVFENRKPVFIKL